MTLITQSPTSVRIEASSVCQLKCPLCPTADGRVAKGRVGSGTLTLENFKKILKANQTIKHIELSNYGEVFLNKELTDILKYAADNSIKISLKNGVNLNSVTCEMLAHELYGALQNCKYCTHNGYRHRECLQRDSHHPNRPSLDD